MTDSEDIDLPLSPRPLWALKGLVGFNKIFGFYWRCSVNVDRYRALKLDLGFVLVWMQNCVIVMGILSFDLISVDHCLAISGTFHSLL